MTKQIWNTVWIAFFITGCAQMCQRSHSELSAEEVIEYYLNTALNMKDISGRNDLLELTTDDLQASLASASDQDIKEAYLDKEYKLHSFSVLERDDLTPRETKITYRLTYQEIEKEDKGKESALITTDNTVLLLKEDGKWFIKDVEENKTSFIFPESEETQIRAKPQ